MSLVTTHLENFNEKQTGKSRDSTASRIDRVVLNLQRCFPSNSQHNMRAAKRAKLEVPVSEMNGELENGHNRVEHETDAGALSRQQIMALRAVHIG